MTTIIFWSFSPKLLNIYHQVSFFNSEDLLSSIEQCTWLHLYFPFGKFHLGLLHETDFDIRKDRFCWIDIFIMWFKDYQLPYQFVRLLLKVEICSSCKCNYNFFFMKIIEYLNICIYFLGKNYCRLDFPYFSRRTPPNFYSSSLSVRPVDQQRRQLAVRFYSRCCYVKSGVSVSARRIGSAMNRLYTKQTKHFGPNNFCIWFFLKVRKKLFVSQKIN